MAGTARTEVAVGTSSEESMFATTRAAAPAELGSLIGLGRAMAGAQAGLGARRRSGPVAGAAAGAGAAPAPLAAAPFVGGCAAAVTVRGRCRGPIGSGW